MLTAVGTCDESQYKVIRAVLPCIDLLLSDPQRPAPSIPRLAARAKRPACACWRSAASLAASFASSFFFFFFSFSRARFFSYWSDSFTPGGTFTAGRRHSARNNNAEAGPSSAGEVSTPFYDSDLDQPIPGAANLSPDTRRAVFATMGSPPNTGDGSRQPTDLRTAPK